jgi:pimeloyl-ACP methyl ester carboxylesterase
MNKILLIGNGVNMRIFLLWLLVCNTGVSYATYEFPDIPTVHYETPSPWNQVPIVPESQVVHWSLTVNPALIYSYPDAIRKELMNEVIGYQKSILSSEEYKKFINWFFQHAALKGSLVRIPVADVPPRLPAPLSPEVQSNIAIQISETPSTFIGKTRYPIVFLHGLAGKIQYRPLAPCLKYWARVEQELGKSGAGFDIYFTEASFLGDSIQRAPTLFKSIKEILRKTGAKKVHIIGHSQGGLDARVLQTGLGQADQIASITTLSSPHLGLKIDKVPLQYKTLLQMANLLFGNKIFPPFMDFRSSYMESIFNPAFPYLEGVPFFSYGGKSFEPEESDHSWGKAFRRALLRNMSLKLKGSYPSTNGQPLLHDGLVPVQATRWGQFLGVVDADHLEQVLGGGRFSSAEFYRAQLDMLRALEQTPTHEPSDIEAIRDKSLRRGALDHIVLASFILY